MKLGIYTPTHRADHLAECAQSVARQVAMVQGADVEWCLLLNGQLEPEQLPDAVRELGPWVHLARADNKDGNVGALKRRACEELLERGAEVLVELDHDDVLAGECLPRVLELVAAGAGFVASDTACESKFGLEYGWQVESRVVDGARLWVHRTPEICSRSLFEIFYAPNHVRAWTRAAYERAGGYDAALAVCDDHDLMCRTYIAGVPMRLIHAPLYIQREHKQQTQVTANAQIQAQQGAVGARHLYALAAEESRRRGLRMIDLGAAHNPAPGYESVDVAGGADHTCDVRKGLPFENDSIGVVRAHDFLEHIEPEHVPHVMNEIYRVLAPGGWLLTSTPSTDGRGAWQDPTHRSGWNSNSWWYYSKAELAQYVPALQCRFQLARVVNHHPTPWHQLHQIVYCDAALWCLKGQQQIGRVEI